MNAKLRKIDEAGEILLKKYQRGEITEAQWITGNRKLIDRAEAIFEKAKAKAA